MSQAERNVEEKDTTRRTMFIVVALGSALLVAGLVYLATRPAARTGDPRLQGAMRPDSPDFAPHREHLIVEFNADQNATQAERPLGDVVIQLNPVVRNFTGRTINGLELHAVGLDLSGNVVKERYIVAVPTRQPELAANKTLTVPITFEGIKKDNVPASLKVELSGVKFK